MLQMRVMLEICAANTAAVAGVGCMLFGRSRSGMGKRTLAKAVERATYRSRLEQM